MYGIGEKGIGPKCWKSDVHFPDGNETSIGAGHRPRSAKTPCGRPCLLGVRSVLIRKPREIFLGLKDTGPPPREYIGVDSGPHRGSARLGAPAVFGHFDLFLTFPGLEIGVRGEGNTASSRIHGTQPSLRAWPDA